MSSLVLDLGLPSSNGYLQGRKQAKGLGKDRERSCLRLQRIIISRHVGMLLAFIISVFSLFMLLNVTSRVSSPSKPITGDDPPSDMIFNEQHLNFSMEDIQISSSQIPPPLERMESFQGHESIGDGHVSFSSNPPPHERLERIRRQANFSMQRIDNYQRMPWPLISSDHPLPSGHPCQGFTLPPPPADKKRTGPRPCPVCYLPIEKAIDAMPMFTALRSSAIKQLSYVEELPKFPQGEQLLGTEFGGHPTLEDRWKSYQIQENMKIHCGFAQGVKPGAGSGFEIEEADQVEMDRCTGIVVASAIFGNYDQLQQPENVSEESMNSICFFMFIDEETHRHLNTTSEIKNGVWRLVVVHNLPYSDARRNGKIPKLLLHRLFPNARFSLWIDGKLKLVVDPYQVLERFLWRRNLSFAISRHYKRFDVFEEAEANKAAGKYNNASINAQVDFYRSEGLAPYDRTKSFFPSDVPEGCVIIREHTPVTNLFTCLWFNEVDRFTSRDQLSFAVVRDKLMERIPFRLSMFLDCERRNFVVQEYHRDLLEQRKATVNIATTLSRMDLRKPHGDPGVNVSPRSALPIRTSSKSHGRHRRGASTRRRMGSRLAITNA